MPNCLIIGGTSGLGLNLATKLRANYTVYVTGRNVVKTQDITFKKLDLTQQTGLSTTIKKFVDDLPAIDLLIYAVGFYQEGTITQLTDADIQKMLAVGLEGAVYLLRGVLSKQGQLPEWVAITSTSQWTPRLLEPIYTAVKAGLAALSNSVSLDERVGKVLVAGPAGMATPFWKNGRDVSDMLDPAWVADQILELRQKEYKYQEVRILRNPQRVEIIEVRQ